jgi:calcineurin-like phosphoesterase family protein
VVKMRKILYISDTHFGHENSIKLDGRPFLNSDDMNQTMLNNWNSVTSKEDLVYILGDFMWNFKDTDFEFARQLNGRKRLIKGNHDKTHNTNYKRLFEAILDYEKIKDNDRVIIASHYPMIAYDGSYAGRKYHFYGHVHQTEEYLRLKKFILENRTEKFPMEMYNVGAMMPYMDYTPRTADEIILNGRIKGE